MTTARPLRLLYGHSYKAIPLDKKLWESMDKQQGSKGRTTKVPVCGLVPATVFHVGRMLYTL